MPKPPSRFRVLVVDDNRAIHEDFRKILCPASPTEGALNAIEMALFAAPVAPEAEVEFEIASAYQCDEAVDLVKRSVQRGEPYAVAFVDVRMPPGPDGIQTLARMWKFDPRLQGVICTAYCDHSWNDITRALGHSDGFLVMKKPFDSIEVLQSAHSLARKWTLGRQIEQQLADLESIVSQRTRSLEGANRELVAEIEKRTQAENDLKHIATHDALTGLPNRILLNDRLTSALTRAIRHHSRAALLLLDLDSFKEVNDSYGHAAGDELLHVVAGRLRAAVRACDTVARMGGDEFVVLLEELAEPEDAAIVAQRILESCSAVTTVLERHEVRTPPSIGIAIFPNDSTDAETLLKSADLAMYQAKAAGGATYRFFDPEMLTGSVERVEIRGELVRALEREEFELWYQPLVDLENGTVSGMEALLRWRHPERGMVPPLKFITAAENCGLIVPIGRWVLETACAQLSRWQKQGMVHLTVAVNVSARELRAPDYERGVLEALARWSIEPCRLELELTESAAFGGGGDACDKLRRLADKGVRIVIDDFGSGYSSLDRLKSMPVHALKIDRFFVKDVADDPRDAAIVCAIVTMAHSLGITVVAEGIETYEQLEFLRRMDWRTDAKPVCDKAQGFLLGHPLPADAATAALTRPFGRADQFSMTG